MNRADRWSGAARWDEGRARSALQAWRRSGLSVRAFCGEQGIDPQRLYWWRKKLGVGAAEPAEALTLVPAMLTSSSSPAAVVHVSGRCPITIEVADTARVSPCWLAETVAALEGGR